jgi:glycosyltransferase involved in cell wall biosynthesis
VISIIIPTFNRKELLAELLRSLANEKCEIVVVDDRSTDGTAEVLKKQFPKVKYILGDGKGQKFAKQKGVDNSKGDIIGFIDDDSRVDAGIVRTVENDFAKGELIVQTRLVFLNKGEKMVEADRPDIGMKRWNLRQTGQWNYGTEPKYVELCAECGVFFSRKLIADVPWFDDKLVGDGYGESLSFSLRTAERGKKILFEPKAVVWHIGAKTGGSIERYEKERATFCTPFAEIIATNLTYLNKRFNRSRLPLVKLYFILAGTYLSVIGRKNCLKYFLSGIRAGNGLWKD